MAAGFDIEVDNEVAFKSQELKESKDKEFSFWGAFKFNAI